MKNKIRKALNALTDDPKNLLTFKDNPNDFAKRLGLDEDARSALVGADLLIVSSPSNPLSANSTTTYTFITGITITGSAIGLQDLDRSELITVIDRLLTDKVYFKQLSSFLKK